MVPVNAFMEVPRGVVTNTSFSPVRAHLVHPPSAAEPLGAVLGVVGLEYVLAIESSFRLCCG